MYGFVILSPLLGFFLPYFFKRTFGSRSFWVLSLFNLFFSLTLSSELLFISVNTNFEFSYLFEFLTFFSSGFFFDFSWDFSLDFLSIFIIYLILTISSFIQIFSVGYIKSDPSFFRFNLYIIFFSFSILLLVSSANFLCMFIGWEIVGLASFLLINFWFSRQEANWGAFKAFSFNRVGDASLLISMCLFYGQTSSLNIDYIICFYTSSFHTAQLILPISFLTLGAIAKSAQFFFHSWLPDAMEGPTPVSALLHSATIVTAGVYLLLRFADVICLLPSLQFFISCIGVFTSFYASFVATTVLDSKKSTAYTTLGQLGFIFYAVGSLAFSTAIFHLFIHGFYKSFSFLENAIELSNLDDEQDGSLTSFISTTLESLYDFFGFLVFLSVNALPLSSPSVSKELIVFNAMDSASLFFSFFFFALLFVGFMDSCYDDSSFEYSNSISYLDSGSIYLTSFPILFSYFSLGSLAILIIFFTEDIFINLSFFWGDFYGIFILKNGSFLLLFPFFATLITTFFLPSNRLFVTSTYDFKLLSTNLFYYDVTVSEFFSKFFLFFSFLFFKNFDRGILEFFFIKPFLFFDFFIFKKSSFNFFSKFLIALVFTFFVWILND